jgi:hypothetical protein
MSSGKYPRRRHSGCGRPRGRGRIPPAPTGRAAARGVEGRQGRTGGRADPRSTHNEHRLSDRRSRHTALEPQVLPGPSSPAGLGVSPGRAQIVGESAASPGAGRIWRRFALPRAPGLRALFRLADRHPVRSWLADTRIEWHCHDEKLEVCLPRRLVGGNPVPTGLHYVVTRRWSITKSLLLMKF